MTGHARRYCAELVIGIQLAASIGIALVGCRYQEVGLDGNSDKARSRRTLFVLREISRRVEIRIAHGDLPPAQDKAFVQWLGLADEFHCWGAYDATMHAFTDAWKRPIFVVTEGGKAVGVGSHGPDGHWQGGEGDDIVVRFGEVLGGSSSSPGREAGRP